MEPGTIESEVGARVTAQPAGTGVMVKPTVPVKLLTGVIVTVEVTVVPAAMFKADGEAEIEKLGAGGGTGDLLFPKSRVQ